MKDDEIRKSVRKGYARIARGGKVVTKGYAGIATGEKPAESVSTVDTAECAVPETGTASCCAPQWTASKAAGYSDKELGAIPQRAANLGLGCGNPTALALLKEGEVVLDLGSGGGIDCFLAANIVGKKGRVIGVDMTPEMIEQARDNARKGNYTNVEFRLGEIENLPVADNSVDAIISNCVINLSPDKSRVFQEAYRALKPGGRVMVSDMVLLKKLPDAIRSSVEAYVGCVAGASLKKDYLAAVASAGFQDVAVIDETSFPIALMTNDPTAKAIMAHLEIAPEELKRVANSMVSVNVRAVKPD